MSSVRKLQLSAPRNFSTHEAAGGNVKVDIVELKISNNMHARHTAGRIICRH